jgi:hypothetical protein
MNFLEHFHPVHAFPKAIIAANEDIFNGDPASDVISMENAQTAVFLIINNSGIGNATIEVFACDDTTPTTTTAISFLVRSISAADTQVDALTESKAFLTSTGMDMIYIVEVDQAKVNEVSGRKYVQLRCAEVTNQPVDGAIAAFLTGMRYTEDDPGTQVT